MLKRIKIYFISIFVLSACGIKADPVPPTKQMDWGEGLKIKSEKSEEDENQ